MIKNKLEFHKEFVRFIVGVECLDGLLYLTDKGFKKPHMLDNSTVKLFLSPGKAKEYMFEHYHYDESIKILKVVERIDNYVDTCSNNEKAPNFV